MRVNEPTVSHEQKRFQSLSNLRVQDSSESFHTFEKRNLAVQLWDQQEEVLLGLLSLNVIAEVYSQITSDMVYPTVHDKYSGSKKCPNVLPCLKE